MRTDEIREGDDSPTRHAGPPIVLPLGLLAVGTLVLQFTGLDQAASALLFDGEAGRWLGRGNAVCAVVDDVGRYCVLVPLAIGLILIVTGRKLWSARNGGSEKPPVPGGSPSHPGGIPSRLRTGIFILLAFALCHVITTEGFKRFVDRPRPRATVEFGGTEAFRPVLQPGFLGEGNSFPSTHAVSGFSPLVLYFAFRRSRKRTALGCAIAGAVIGCGMGFNRMVQGAHFLSDILWAAGSLYIASYLVYRFWFVRDDAPPPSSTT